MPHDGVAGFLIHCHEHQPENQKHSAVGGRLGSQCLDYLGIVTGLLHVRDVEPMRTYPLEVAKNPGAKWSYIGLLTVVSVFNGAFSRTVKERLAAMLQKFPPDVVER